MDEGKAVSLKRAIVWSLASVIVTTAPVVAAQMYSGKPIAAWITALGDSDPATQQAAAEALGAIGPAGAKQSVPALVAVLKKPVRPLEPNRTYRTTTIDLAGKATEVDLDAAVQIAVAKALGDSGQAAGASVPTLVGLLGQDRTTAGKSGLPKDASKMDTLDIRAVKNMLAVSMGDLAVGEAAATALARIGRPAVKALIGALASPTANVRSGAARALGQIGSDAADALPALTRVAESDEFSGARQNAQRAVERIQQK